MLDSLQNQDFLFHILHRVKTIRKCSLIHEVGQMFIGRIHPPPPPKQPLYVLQYREFKNCNLNFGNEYSSAFRVLVYSVMNSGLPRSDYSGQPGADYFAESRFKPLVCKQRNDKDRFTETIFNCLFQKLIRMFTSFFYKPKKQFLLVCKFAKCCSRIQIQII